MCLGTTSCGSEASLTASSKACATCRCKAFQQCILCNLFATKLSCLCRNGTAQDSCQKLQLILQLCQELGIHTTPARLGNLCLVPLLSWHHSSWDTEPDIQGVPHVSALSIADYGACIWPDTGPGTSVNRMLFMLVVASALILNWHWVWLAA
jgi:hypothetical protein